MEYILDNQVKGHISARFRPTAKRLNDIILRGQTLLDDASDADLEQFTE